MFNTKNLSYLKPFFPLLFMLLQLASIAIAIAFPALVLLPFIISIISATFSFSTMTRSNTKTVAAFLVVSVALAILTWGTSSVITQFGFYGFMHLLMHGPLLLSTIAGLLTSLFFTLYHYIILYQLTSEDAYVKISTYLVRSLVPAAIMGCLALLFGLLLLNIMPLALSTVLIPIPLLAVCGWLAGNFLGLVGVNQVWIAYKTGCFFAVQGWRDLFFENSALYYDPRTVKPIIPANKESDEQPKQGEDQEYIYRLTSNDEEPQSANEIVFFVKGQDIIIKKLGHRPFLFSFDCARRYAEGPRLYELVIGANERSWTKGTFNPEEMEELSIGVLSEIIRGMFKSGEAATINNPVYPVTNTKKIGRIFLVFSAIPGEEGNVYSCEQLLRPLPSAVGPIFVRDDGLQTHPVKQATVSFNSPTGCPTCSM